MSIDLEHEVRTYAEYLDEVLPTVTADSVRTEIPHRSRPVVAPPPWYRRPVVVFLAAMAGVLAVAVAQLLLLDGPTTEVSVPPATTLPTPEITTTVATTPPAPEVDTTDPQLPVVPELDAITLVPTEVNPARISTVVGDIEFTTWRFPPDQGFLPFGDPISTAHGLVAYHGGHLELQWSADYTTWHRTPTGVDPELVTIAGDDIVVAGTTSATRFAWDGEEWAPQSQFQLPSEIDWMVFGPRGAVVASATTIYHAPDGVTFSEAQRGPDLGVFIASKVVLEEGDYIEGDCRATYGATSAEIRIVVATDAGFVAFTSATHPYGAICAPLLWFSADGNTWDLVSPDSPFGELSLMYLEEPGLEDPHLEDPQQRSIIGRDGRTIVERDGRFVAIGEFGGQGMTDPEGAVWVSDDALAWQRIEAPFWPLGVFASELGWMLTGFYEDEPTGENEPAMWFSTDASTWDGPYEVPVGLERAHLWVGGWYAVGLDWFTVGPDWFAVGPDTVVAVDFEEQLHVIGRIQN